MTWLTCTASMTVGRETDGGGYGDIEVLVTGRVAETATEYGIEGLAVAGPEPRVLETEDLTKHERSRAEALLIEAYQRGEGKP